MSAAAGLDRDDTEAVVAALRRRGARFAFLHGSRAAGTHRPDSDVDVAAWFGSSPPPDPWVVGAELPAGIDVLVLDGAPLELAGRVAMHGQLLFDDDPPRRVAWQADTRVMYLDEQPLQRELEQVFMEARLHGR
jgi:predicted nucleotidyltransferase